MVVLLSSQSLTVESFLQAQLLKTHGILSATIVLFAYYQTYGACKVKKEKEETMGIVSRRCQTNILHNVRLFFLNIYIGTTTEMKE